MPALTRRGFLRNLAFQTNKRTTPKKTLVCIFLRGGADTLNMLVPYGDDEYYRLRPVLSIPAPGKTRGDEGAAIKIDDFYALHPKMNPLYPLYRSGDLAFIQSVGTDNPTGSHFEAQDQMEHGEGFGQSAGGGWLGRHLRSIQGATASPLSAVAIGQVIPESLRGAPSVSALRALEELQIKFPGGQAEAVSSALESLYGAENDLLGERGKETLELLTRVRGMRDRGYVPEKGVTYPEKDDFARGLREVARLIKADVGLEVAAIDLDGWDTHFFQGVTGGLHGGLVGKLSDGLAAFYADLEPVREQVTVLVMTEFGRRIYENGSIGTDHGRGFTMMALGAGINGGKVHGEWPGLEENEALLGPGGFDVKIDYRSVLSEVLGGVIGNRHLDRVFPMFKPKRVGLVG